MARRFGYVRETNFGRLFEVYSRPGSNDLAYRPVPLGAHTDNPYREPVPGVQLLHCLVNETTGGWSTLVDSLSVAQALQEIERRMIGRQHEGGLARHEKLLAARVPVGSLGDGGQA